MADFASVSSTSSGGGGGGGGGGGASIFGASVRGAAWASVKGAAAASATGGAKPMDAGSATGGDGATAGGAIGSRDGAAGGSETAGAPGETAGSAIVAPTEDSSFFGRPRFFAGLSSGCFFARYLRARSCLGVSSVCGPRATPSIERRKNQPKRAEFRPRDRYTCGQFGHARTRAWTWCPHWGQALRGPPNFGGPTSFGPVPKTAPHLVHL